MPGATPQQLATFARRQQLAVLAIRDRTARLFAATWAQVVTDPTEPTASRWVSVMSGPLAAAKLAAADLGLSYIRTYSSMAAGEPAPESPLVADEFVDPRGVPDVEVLMRPIVQLRWLLSKGEPLPAALDAGGARARQIGATDPMLAYREATSAAMQDDDRIVGWRRVPEPRACTFCLLVSTQRYHDKDLMPIHPACGCTVAPIIGKKDPGQVLDRDLVDKLMAADPALGKRGDNAKRAVEAAIHQHGELGPTVYPGGVEFDFGPAT